MFASVSDTEKVQIPTRKKASLAANLQSNTICFPQSQIVPKEIHQNLRKQKYHSSKDEYFCSISHQKKPPKIIMPSKTKLKKTRIATRIGIASRLIRSQGQHQVHQLHCFKIRQLHRLVQRTHPERNQHVIGTLKYKMQGPYSRKLIFVIQKFIGNTFK